MRFSLLPSDKEYFTLFTLMTEKIEEAATVLVEMFQSETADFESFAKKIKDIEHNCDELTHKITTRLTKSLITPFNREDIYTLTVALDDVCDYIDAAARAVLMYNIQNINDHSKHLAKVMQVLTMEIHSAVSMLKNPQGLNQHLVEIHRLENEADDVYFRAVAELFHKPSDSLTVIKWKELYEILENATDRCESVANIIEGVILKHHKLALNNR